MAEKTMPPVSIGQWFEQVKADQSIPEEFKNGAEDKIKLSSTSFSSGSVVKASEILRMRIIWHKTRQIEALGSLMKDDPDHKYTGYVSDENIIKASLIFNDNRNQWKRYFEELKLRAAYREWRHKELGGLADAMAIPPRPLPHRPSKECGIFYEAMRWQLLALTAPAPPPPTFEELERTSPIRKPGPNAAPIEITGFSGINQPVTPLKLNSREQEVQKTLKDGFQGTPAAASYYPAKGGKTNKPATDESYINWAILLLLQAVSDAGLEFINMEWLPDRLAFHLVEIISTKDTDTGEDVKRGRELMEARVDGYLCRKSDVFEEHLNTDALAIIEAKPYTRSSALSTIRRQEGAEMACWISQAGDLETGHLRASSSGRKRRLMISQDRHEIYIIVGEYGPGFEDHIRPSKSNEPGSDLPQYKVGNPGRPIMGSSAQVESRRSKSDSATSQRDLHLLTGSPSYLRRVEGSSIIVEAKRKSPHGQPIHPVSETTESHRTEEEWKPDPGDFLVMNEFGPFLVTDASHMAVLFRRLIALMLELRGADPNLKTEPPCVEFFSQGGQDGPPTPNEPVPQPPARGIMKKARSFPGVTEQTRQDWVVPMEKSRWKGQ